MWSARAPETRVVGPIANNTIPFMGKNVDFVLKYLGFLLKMFDCVLKMLDFSVGGVVHSQDREFYWEMRITFQRLVIYFGFRLILIYFQRRFIWDGHLSRVKWQAYVYQACCGWLSRTRCESCPPVRAKPPPHTPPTPTTTT